MIIKFPIPVPVWFGGSYYYFLSPFKNNNSRMPELSSSSSSLQTRIVTANNAAVEFLRLGQYEMAAETLRIVQQDVRFFVLDAPTNHTSTIATSQVGVHGVVVASSTMDQVVSPNNAFFLFREAFALTTIQTVSHSVDGVNVPLCEHSASASPDSTLIVGAVSLFNMALVFHLQGLTTSTTNEMGTSSSDSMLRKALYLYDLAIALFEEESDAEEVDENVSTLPTCNNNVVREGAAEYEMVSILDETPDVSSFTRSDHFSFILIAASSNAGHIHSHCMDDWRLVVHYQEWIRFLFMSSAESPAGQHQPASLLERLASSSALSSSSSIQSNQSNYGTDDVTAAQVEASTTSLDDLVWNASFAPFSSCFPTLAPAA